MRSVRIRRVRSLRPHFHIRLLRRAAVYRWLPLLFDGAAVHSLCCLPTDGATACHNKHTHCCRAPCSLEIMDYNEIERSFVVFEIIAVDFRKFALQSFNLLFRFVYSIWAAKISGGFLVLAVVVVHINTYFSHIFCANLQLPHYFYLRRNGRSRWLALSYHVAHGVALILINLYVGALIRIVLFNSRPSGFLLLSLALFHLHACGARVNT